MIGYVIVIAALLLLQVWERLQQRKERAEWANERSALLTRITHPTVVQLPGMERTPHEPPEPDDFERVGRVIDLPTDGTYAQRLDSH